MNGSVEDTRLVREKAFNDMRAEIKKTRDVARADYTDNFQSTVRHAEWAFAINMGINIVVVILGVIFMLASLTYAAKGDIAPTVAFGTFSVATFVSTFFIMSQRKVQETVGDLAQIQMLYRTYWWVEEQCNWWAHMNEDASIVTLQKIDEHRVETVKRLTDLIELHIGRDDNASHDENAQRRNSPPPPEAGN